MADLQMKTFEAASKEAALKAANDWMADFSQHGPLKVTRIAVDQVGAKWVATVKYRT